MRALMGCPLLLRYATTPAMIVFLEDNNQQNAHTLATGMFLIQSAKNRNQDMRTFRSPQRRDCRPDNNLRQQQSITDSRREQVRSILTL